MWIETLSSNFCTELTLNSNIRLTLPLNRRYGEVVLAARTQFISVNVAFCTVSIHWSAPRAFHEAGVVALVNRWSFLRDRGLNKNEFLGCPLGQKCSHWGEAVV